MTVQPGVEHIEDVLSRYRTSWTLTGRVMQPFFRVSAVPCYTRGWPQGLRSIKRRAQYSTSTVIITAFQTLRIVLSDVTDRCGCIEKTHRGRGAPYAVSTLRASACKLENSMYRLLRQCAADYQLARSCSAGPGPIDSCRYGGMYQALGGGLWWTWKMEQAQRRAGAACHHSGFFQ